MKDEYLEIVRELRRHHSLFSQFWTVGNIVEIRHPKMPTMAIAFDKRTGAGLQYLINPDYWAKLNKTDKCFGIAHEILHVYFDHGRRSRGMDPILANVAQDVVINHYLVDFFGFKREDLTFGETYCWLDTVFPKQNVPADRCFEFYYELLEKEAKKQGGKEEGSGGNGLPQTVDIHDFMDEDGEMDEDLMNEIQEAVDDMMDRITPDEVENFEEIVEKGNKGESDRLGEQKQKVAGTMSGTMQKRIRLGRVIKKRKWEEVVADILGRFVGMQRDVTLELWTRPNRRLSSLGGDLILPASVDETIPVRDRVDVWFFQDTSGSCVDFAERFFKAAASLPTDRFRVRMFCFDTKVYETSIASGKLYGFGGTAFQPIEDAIQGILQKEPKTKYPQAVFVVTDGMGSMVTPEFPERWFWFLSAKYLNYIPKKSRHFMLKDYE